MTTKTALQVRKETSPAPREILPSGLVNAVDLWAIARTDAESARRADLVRDKTNAVLSFFGHCGKAPAEVNAIDIATWQASLEGRGLAPVTIYAMVSRVSSFYTWAMGDPSLAEHIHTNPVTLARPKAPKAYQGESVKAFDDGEAIALLATVKAAADAGDIIAKRDHTLLLFYFSTGMRRSEVIRLTWGNVKINGTVTITGKVKGGDILTRTIKDPRVRDALLDYLTTSGRLETMDADSPLWTSHDRANTRPGAALTGHAFAKRFKRWAKLAGIEGTVHLHQTRHTVARMVGEKDGIGAAQEILDHEKQQTTRIYFKRISVKKDKHSTSLLDQLEA